MAAWGISALQVLLIVYLGTAGLARLCSSSAPLCSPPIICEVHLSLTYLTLNQLWDPAIVHGAICKFVLIICHIQEFLIPCSAITHVLFCSFPCPVNMLQFRPGSFQQPSPLPTTLVQVWTAKCKRLTGTHSWSLNHITELKVSNFVEAVSDRKTAGHSGNAIYSKYA